MTKHTPWTIVPANEHHGFYIEDAAGQTVCDLYFKNEAGEVVEFEGAERHANLIVNAVDSRPDMYEALEEYVRRYPNNAAYDQAVAALAKARGESLTFDPNKPVIRRDGSFAEIVRTDGGGVFPIMARVRIGGEEVLESFTAEGKYRPDGSLPELDLVNRGKL